MTARLYVPRESRDAQPIPKALLRACFGLCAVALALVYGARLGGYEPGRDVSDVAVESRLLAFDTAGGETTIRDAETGDAIVTLSAEKSGFHLGVLRGLSHVRAREGVTAPEHYALTRWEDGRLTLADTGTGETFELNAFGPDNLGAFVRLLPSREGTR